MILETAASRGPSDQLVLALQAGGDTAAEALSAVLELARDVLGPDSELAEGPPYALSSLQRMYLFSRSDTIYAGSNEMQRNIISERALGLPREPKPV